LSAGRCRLCCRSEGSRGDPLPYSARVLFTLPAGSLFPNPPPTHPPEILSWTTVLVPTADTPILTLRVSPPPSPFAGSPFSQEAFPLLVFFSPPLPSFFSECFRRCGDARYFLGARCAGAPSWFSGRTRTLFFFSPSVNLRSVSFFPSPGRLGVQAVHPRPAAVHESPGTGSRRAVSYGGPEEFHVLAGSFFRLSSPGLRAGRKEAFLKGRKPLVRREVPFFSLFEAACPA